MRVIIAGSRHLTDFRRVAHCIEHAMDVHLRLDADWTGIEAVLSGGADGPDTIGAQMAEKLGIPVEYYIPGQDMLPSWEEVGKAAGPIRNEYMAKRADTLVLVWDGTSPGSASMKAFAEREGLRIVEVLWQDVEAIPPDVRGGLVDALRSRSMDPSLTDEEREYAHEAANQIEEEE